MMEVGSKKQGKAKYGLPKTNENTADMILLMSNLIMTHAVRYSADYCCFNSDPVAIKEDFEDQMRAFKGEKLPSGKIRYSGKAPGKNDDLAVSTIMGPYWSSQFKRNPRYKKIIEKRGMR